MRTKFIDGDQNVVAEVPDLPAIPPAGTRVRLRDGDFEVTGSAVMEITGRTTTSPGTWTATIPVRRADPLAPRAARSEGRREAFFS